MLLNLSDEFPAKKEARVRNLGKFVWCHWPASYFAYPRELGAIRTRKPNRPFPFRGLIGHGPEGFSRGFSYKFIIGPIRDCDGQQKEVMT
jgi:hypothetical protein